MATTDYSISQYISDIQVIASEETDPKALTEAIKPLAARLAATDEFKKDKYKACDEEQGFGVHLLHEEENHDLGVFLFSWLPGRGTLPHNHKTWAVVAMVEGEERETYWKRKDDGAKDGYAEIEKTGEVLMTPGDIATCLEDHIHAVTNAGDSVSMSLHTYGRHINYTGRSQFDPDKNAEIPFVVTVDE
ncbi:MAG: Unknown protein [uncultured Thiotrichaceae bacterium]|uniref:Cysteine dioxygenase n=1 Tax=uncultured Thiotrichaceae bacterium TaxID=298394 RepID=A0A6S6TZR8_9GAMM|nr:MAG: Unknown protein [uncultured Thiotrichaceae bacterium]